MDTQDNTLEERLARLEAGETMEECLADLTETDASLLKKAAMLRTIASTASVPNEFAAQRHELLRLAKENNKMSSKSSSLANIVRSRWVFPVTMAGSAFAVLTCFVIFALLTRLGAPGWINQHVLNQPTGTGSTGTVVLDAPDPKSAVLKDSRGLVEIQDGDGTWKATRDGQIVKAGQRIRTGVLSSVALGFYDGSQTQIGPNSEVSLDQLDAQKSGPRVVVLTQQVGESKHDVAQSSDPASLYEVHTPSGVGTAQGTSFTVFVATTLLTRFDVDEGAVSVTNLDVTVVVVAGQSTVVVSGEVPVPPVFRMSGEGEVQKTGQVWHIAGRAFRTDSNTGFVGNPQVGDWVRFKARIVADGSPILDRVELVEQTPETRFAFIGAVDSIGDAAWTIAGHAVHVNQKTVIDGDIQVGQLVSVRGNVAQDGALWATDINLIEENEEGLPFEFVGVIDEMGASEWTISGNTIEVDDKTHIESDLNTGDIVHVRGRIQSDGTWLARSIERAEEDEREFTFIGSVESLDPWMVDGVGFDTDSRTEIEEGIQVGDRVLVEGRVLDNGDWLAEEIELLEDAEPREFEFTGIVNSIDPWDVGGIDFTVDEHTVIEGQIVVNDLVHVNGVILPDGTLLAQKIELLDDDLGCLSFSTAVREASADQIVLLDWHVVHLGGEIEVEGEINVAVVIIISGCTQEDGDFVITHIIVIYQLETLPVIIKPPSDGHGDEGGEEEEEEHDE